MRIGDSDNDLAIANFTSDHVSILLNNGDGTFQAPVNYGAGDGPSSVFCSDLDGDNDDDLAVANIHSDNVQFDSILGICGKWACIFVDQKLLSSV